MSLFEFQLKKLSDVLPWGEEPDLYLHWFGLTDGIYYMNVGDEQLFRASTAIMEHWVKEYPDINVNDVYVDYQVVRLYEDLLEKLVDMLQPVPSEIHQLISTQETQNHWTTQLWDIFESTDSEEIEDLYSVATEWWNYHRSLSTMHLSEGPNIWIWNSGETVHIRWNSESKNINGIQPWTTVRGDYTLPLGEFREEILSFHERFMDEMTYRIRQLMTDNPIPHIKIDMQSLEKEHEERKNSLNDALAKTPSVKNWDTVIEAINKLKGPNKAIPADAKSRAAE
nr:hypothetical protein [uncultured bacterium]